VPEFAVDPGNAGNDAVGFDGAQNDPGFGVDLMELAASRLDSMVRRMTPVSGSI